MQVGVFYPIGLAGTVERRIHKCTQAPVRCHQKDRNNASQKKIETLVPQQHNFCYGHSFDTCMSGNVILSLWQ